MQHQDIFFKISEFLLDKDKIMLTMASQWFDKLKHKFIYQQKIHINRIIGLSYFDNFESVEIELKSIIPRRVKNVHFLAQTDDIPTFVTHLIFSNDFNQPIERIIPSSVTYLIFGHKFNQPIKGIIPSSVIHLRFGAGFNQPIVHCIPSSVTHLSFRRDFNQDIKDCIPSSVICLQLGWYFSKSIAGCIPPSIKELY